MSRKRYCPMCDDVFAPAIDGDCPECGAGMEPWPEVSERERDDDDGRTYADPRDEIEERRH
jgi:hypothetical protein